MTLKQFRNELRSRLGLKKKTSKRKDSGAPVRRSPDEALAMLLAGQTDLTIFDVGANQGQSATKFRKIFPGAKIYAFEPLPSTFEVMREAHAADRLVVPENLALGSEVGTIDFNVNVHDYNHTFLTPAAGAEKWADIKHVDRIKVPISTVDAYCEDHGVKRINLLKVDAEGADIFVLNGAKNMLRKQSVDIVYTEIILNNIFDGQGTLYEFLALMAEYGYFLYDFFDQRHTADGRLNLTNGLFVRNTAF
ncbi:FkbM family methyltransferase [Roseibium sp.]|uniref:FkbM family methyltransferase n=1 Tax=Roseibium sp. TaxID=1936156 RepID=UPI003A972093